MRRKIPSTHALICFEAAARHESYTRAADELALTQSAVSRQISALEHFVGVMLFRRTRHGVALTAEGADYARRIARQLDVMERDTLDAMARQGQGGALNLAAVPTFATRWLIPRLPALARVHPDITLHIEPRTRPFLFDETPFDAALYTGTREQATRWAGTHVVELMHEEVVPVCSPELITPRKQISPAEVAALPLLQQSTRPGGWRRWFDAQGIAAERDQRGPRYELFSMLAAAAMHGLGIALIPRALIEPELARRELVVACDLPLRGERAYFLVTPAMPQERPVLRHFRDWLVAQAQQAM
jgi:DNA-binding transcriptional LysR family regulator